MDKLIDLDFDDPQRLSQERDIFGIQANPNPDTDKNLPLEHEIDIMPLPALEIHIPKPIECTNPLTEQLEWNVLRLCIQTVLEIFSGQHPLIENVRDYLIRYGEARDQGSAVMTLTLRGSLCLEGAELRKHLKHLCTSLSPRASVSRTQGGSVTRIKQLERNTAIIRCALMVFRMIAIYETWPGVGMKWNIWFERFNQYYTIVKGE